MFQFQRLKIALIILALGNSVGAQEPETRQLARGIWTVEYEGNVMEVQFIERRSEYQAYWGTSMRPRGRKLEAPPGSEVAILHLRTERVTAKKGYGSSLVTFVSLEGRTYETGTGALGGPGENRFDPNEHNYEIPVVVPQGTRFERLEFVREKYDPRYREKLIIDLPGGQ
jgi:hypothetical protein